MPLTAKGNEILAAMRKEYGAEKGESVFYASKNAGKITGVDADAKPRADMSDEDWAELKRTLTKFFAEEAREPEHKADAWPARLDAACAAVDGLARRMDALDCARSDASPEMEAFKARQAERMVRAKTGERRGDALMLRVEAALRFLKKRSESPHHGYAASAKDMVKKARAAFSLAQNQNVASEIERWIAQGNSEMDDAEKAVGYLEDQARRLGM